MGVGQLRFGFINPHGRARQQHLERFDIARKGRNGGFHDRDGITENSPDKAQNARTEKRLRALCGALRPPGILRAAPVDTVERAGQLRGCQRHHPILRRRPDEAPLLEPLGV